MGPSRTPRDRRPRVTPVMLLLLATLGLTGVLTYQAVDAASSHRATAEHFQQAFAAQFAKSQTLDPGNYRAFNQSTIDLVRRFSDHKKSWAAQQAAGQLRSLVWPVFFLHTAREADRFATRLAMYNSGNIEFERPEVVSFWSVTMSEHAAMMAHLLDPQEKALFAKATAFENRFANPAVLQRGPGDPVMAAAREIIDFKTVAEQGICSGQIRSIIDPELGAQFLVRQHGSRRHRIEADRRSNFRGVDKVTELRRRIGRCGPAPHD